MKHLPPSPLLPRRPPRESGSMGEAGFLTVEAVLMIMVLVVLIPVAYTGWNMGFSALKARSVAQQLVQVSDAAKVYARSQGLLTSLVPGKAAQLVTGEDLYKAGVLPHSAGGDLENAWKYTYQVYYSLPADPVPPAVNMTRSLQVVVVTVPPAGGGTVPEEEAAKAASFAGASGGIVTQDTNGILSLGNAVSGWHIKVGDPALPDSGPALGSIGTYASLDDKALNSDVLYRVDVGRPELNQMHVDLDMRDNALKNVGNIQFNATSVKQTDLTTVCGTAAEMDGKVFYHTAAIADQSGLYACKNGKAFLIADSANSAPVQKAKVVKNGDTVDMPKCTDPSDAFIAVSPANVMVNLVVPVLGTSIYTSYKANGTTSWTVTLSAATPAGVPIAPALITGEISVLTSCRKP